MNKWDYIKFISNLSDLYGNKLLEMLDSYNKDNLQDITLEEAKDFYLKMVERIPVASG